MSGRAAELAATVRRAMWAKPPRENSLEREHDDYDWAMEQGKDALSELEALAAWADSALKAVEIWEAREAKQFARAEAAEAEIDRLREMLVEMRGKACYEAFDENTRLRAALEEIVEADLEWSKATDYLQDIARAALAQHTQEHA